MPKVVSLVDRRKRGDDEAKARRKRERLDRRKISRRSSRSIINVLEYALAEAYCGRYESLALVAVVKGRERVSCSWSTTPPDRLLALSGAIHKLADDFYHEMGS